MVEKAFKVKAGSKFEQLYFQSKEERKKFNEAVKEFSKVHGIEMDRYRMKYPLECSLTDEERKRFADQLCKNPGRSGLPRFKVKSEMNQAWRTEVLAENRMKSLDKLEFWQFMFCDVHSGSCSSSLWSYNGTVYGYLADKLADDSNKDAVELCDDMEEIKMSEYYAVIEKEEMEAKEND